MAERYRAPGEDSDPMSLLFHDAIVAICMAWSKGYAFLMILFDV
jgi:hypothetical protein